MKREVADEFGSGFSAENVRFMKPGDRSRCTFIVFCSFSYLEKGGLRIFVRFSRLRKVYDPGVPRMGSPGFISEAAETPGGVYTLKSACCRMCNNQNINFYKEVKLWQQLRKSELG